MPLNIKTKYKMNNTIFLWQTAAATTGQENNPLVTIAFMVVGLAVFYFFMIRPQAKQQKEENNFVEMLKKGAKVVTTGGIHGSIVEVNEETISIMIAPKTFITVQKSSISLSLTKAVYGEKETKK